MNKQYIYLLFSFWISIFFYGCKKDEFVPPEIETNREETQTTDFELSSNALTLDVSDIYTLTTNPSLGNIVWESSNASIAKIENGVITAINNGTATISAKANNITKTCIVSVNTTVFLSAYEYNQNSEEGNAILIKNNQNIELGKDFANGIAVSNGISYVVGNKGTDGFSSTAKLWENETETSISSFGTYAEANNICLLNNNIYVSGKIEGSSTSIACYWKNGVKTNISDETSSAYTYDIAVSSDEKVYVVGASVNSNYILNARVWENGTEQILSNLKSSARSIIINNADVYIGGYEIDPSTNKHKATIWKNGIATYLTTGYFHACVYDVFTIGEDVYAVGFSKNNSNQENIATLWKNGFKTELTDGNYRALASCVKVHNGDVYIAGTIHDGSKNNGVVWKNGEIIKTIDQYIDLSVTGLDVK